ncbi:MAG: hypothetical protein EBV06_04920 [Planctomycetia bacterium]|nr:hypothetical protein [Planctomycetia bacterium]
MQPQDAEDRHNRDRKGSGFPIALPLRKTIAARLNQVIGEVKLTATRRPPWKGLGDKKGFPSPPQNRFAGSIRSPIQEEAL